MREKGIGREMKAKEVIEEAIERLNYLISGDCTDNQMNFVEEITMGIEALEKQIPKTVTHEATLYKCCTCPNCKNVVDEFTTFGESRVRVTYKFCHFCGQALDWSDHPTEKGGVE